MGAQMGPGVGAGESMVVLMGLASLAAGAAAIVGWIVFLIAVWRMMRAHESLAESARIATELMERKQSGRV